MERNHKPTEKNDCSAESFVEMETSSPDRNDTRLRILYLYQLLLSQSDEDHPLSTKQITDKMEELHSIHMHRTTVSSDIALLKAAGFEIMAERKRAWEYYLADRAFSIPELKLLIDAVQSSKFITENKSNKLIKKIEGLASIYEAKSLHRQVYVANRIKTKNESVYYNVDDIQKAISDNCKISFQYFQWNSKKERELRHKGERYSISPWALTWDDENYYMVGYDSEADKIKHYRVDKMLKIQILEGTKREGKELFKDMDMAIYSKKVFGMFGGKEETVTLKCNNSMAGVIIDRFGTEVNITKQNSDNFTVRVPVQVSPQFLGWVFSLGSDVQIIGPKSVVQKMKETISNISEMY